MSHRRLLQKTAVHNALATFQVIGLLLWDVVTHFNRECSFSMGPSGWWRHD